jgi:D-lactate dehydrogenase
MKEVHHMFSTKEFEKMKNNSYLINTSRGELIDTKALYEAVKSKKLKGVALDVTECEQLNSNIGDFDKALKTSDCSCFESGIITQKLMSYDNVIITPHIAYHTRESVNTILDTMFNNIKSHFKGEHTNQVV